MSNRVLVTQLVCLFYKALDSKAGLTLRDTLYKSCYAHV